MKILVIDGQGGRMGKALVETLRRRGFSGEILAVGTNSAATAAMLKAGADEGATGENPVVVASRKADVILGPMGIIAANSLLGEITPAMALAIGQSSAKKVLLPVNQCSNLVVGVPSLTVKELMDKAVELLRTLL
jgi:prephenate dehydrogenase